MDVEVFLTHSNVTDEDVRDRTVIVIDVLRACSTIATALQNGARAVMPVPDMAEASKIAANLDPDVYRLGGERDAEKIEGYHLGNSPLEYTQEEVEDRDVILNTTNGTKALSRAKSAPHLIAGCFLNAGRIVDFIREAGRDVAIICAGRQNRLSLEDTLCAGLMLERLWGGQEPEYATDSAHTAFTLFHTDREDVGSALRRANHAQNLVERGYSDDVEYCFKVDALPVLPYYTDNRLVLYEDLSPAPLADKTESSA
ncbi:2-phosphosulfolactate phosphatase [Longibacter salinarum]|uniref:Probable 2-phosphosulfolactate phosphatase n=1 Tax=Longibacter salinarum TaxID=1850348 RepID=A0A2A8D214_9BACT|nr:2-phosphosulfolactate phosphatase [Longibacter salinarum]PEN14931.1 2-phosphosulfolactate phosphatase [Longibacter salinarum]